MKKILLVLVWGCLSLTGCNSLPVAEDVSQNQAREIIVFLGSHSIDSVSQKASSGKGKYSVLVSKGDYSQALELLQEEQIPKPERLSVDDLLSQGGILPASRDIENLKLDRAYASEIESMVNRLPSVLSAHAVVRLASLGKDNLNSGVSLAVQVRKKSPALENEVREMVDRIVPGIGKEHIWITIHETVLDEGATGGLTDLVSFLGVAEVPPGEYRHLAMGLTVALLVFGICGGILGYYLGIYRKMRDPQSSPQSLVRLAGGPFPKVLGGRTDIEEASSGVLPPRDGEIL